jgi:hypothetical protein
MKENLEYQQEEVKASTEKKESGRYTAAGNILLSYV